MLALPPLLWHKLFGVSLPPLPSFLVPKLPFLFPTLNALLHVFGVPPVGQPVALRKRAGPAPPGAFELFGPFAFDCE